MGEAMQHVRPTVLVVDDESIIRMDLVEALAEAGVDVLEAESADEAISILSARTDISVIVTDVEMAGTMNGVKLAWLVRGRWPPIRIIVMSGRQTPQESDLPARTRFLAKPYHLPQLIEAITQADRP